MNREDCWAAVGPPPRECSESEGEVEVPHFVNRCRVALRGTAWEPSKEREDLFLHGREVEQRVAALEVSLLRLISDLAVLDRGPPLAAPGAADVNPVLHVDVLGLVLVDRGAPENECERQNKTRARLVDVRELVAEAVLDVVAVDGVIHDLEGGLFPCRPATAVRVHDGEAPPLVGRERVEHSVELLRVLLEAIEG